MIVCKLNRSDKPLATIIRTLESVYKPDPVVPEPMLAVLAALSVPAGFVVAPAPVRSR